MIEPLISVIVPAYNQGQHINKCIDSIRMQTYPNIEILLIDDGSDKVYANTYEHCLTNVKGVIHKPKGGVSSARNLGLERAKGDYVCFVDSDDYISPEYCQTLYNLIQKYQVDIAACSYRHVRGDSFNDDTNQYEELLVSERDKWVNILENNNSAEGFLWNKLYSRKCLEGLRFDENLVMCEDQLFVFQAVERVKDIAVTNKPLYFYRMNYDSATHSNRREMVDQRLYVAQRIGEIIKNNGTEQDQDKYYKLVFDARCSLCMWLAQNRPKEWWKELSEQRAILAHESKGFTRVQVLPQYKLLKSGVPIFSAMAIMRSYLSKTKRMIRKLLP